MNELTKIVYYKPVKTTMDVIGLAEIIIDIVVKYHGFSKLIVNK